MASYDNFNVEKLCIIMYLLLNSEELYHKTFTRIMVISHLAVRNHHNWQEGTGVSLHEQRPWNPGTESEVS